MLKRGGEVNTTDIILKVVAAAGIISLALLAPNAAGMILKMFGTRKRKYNLPWYVNTRIQKLEERGLIKLENKNGHTFASLTPKGRLELNRQKMRDERTVPKKWDCKWRVIIFDIKEYRRATRNLLRKELAAFGFWKLQQSVWVSPYPCDEFITLLKADLKIGKDLLYLLVEEMENDRHLKKLFHLP
ncbi:hypothetical protein L0Y69_01960 [bacterium]|nr:hypothetical protein [bacterium]